MKIIYAQTNGEIAILMPVENCGLSVMEIGLKDVPAGVPFLIVEDSDLPSDWSTSAAWEADFSNPNGIGLGPQRYFIAKAAEQIQAAEANLQIAADIITNPESTPEQIEAAMQLSEQMQREIAQAMNLSEQMQDEILRLEGAPM